MSELNQRYGLSARVTLREIDERTLGIEKKIKSRIIQKDALKIVAMAQQIHSVTPDMKVVLVCTNNICSKSKFLLASHNIDLLIEDF